MEIRVLRYFLTVAREESITRAAEVLHASGTAILPALHLDEFGQTAPAGTAVFANSQLTCFLDGSEIGGGDADA